MVKKNIEYFKKEGVKQYNDKYNYIKIEKGYIFLECKINNHKIRIRKDRFLNRKNKKLCSECLKNISEKQCKVCDVIKPINNYYKNKMTIDGYRHICIKCSLIKSTTYNKEHKGKIKENQKIYKDKNKDKIKKYEKNRYQKNKININKINNMWNKITKIKLNNIRKNIMKKIKKFYWKIKEIIGIMRMMS